MLSDWPVLILARGDLSDRGLPHLRTAGSESRGDAQGAACGGTVGGSQPAFAGGEAQVRRTERLAALGQLSAGLAHEIRNPLSTIKGSAEMLLKNVDADGAVAHELAGFISSEVDRTNALVTRFLDFARPLALRLEKTEITEVIDEAVAEVEKHTPPLDVSIYKNYSPDIPPFLLDRQLIERVLYNLLLNAAQASPPQGSVTVKTRQVGDTVEIGVVIDRGSGIAPKDRESIFNPFFTTKSSGVDLAWPSCRRLSTSTAGRLR